MLTDFLRKGTKLVDLINYNFYPLEELTLVQIFIALDDLYRRKWGYSQIDFAVAWDRR